MPTGAARPVSPARRRALLQTARLAAATIGDAVATQRTTAPRRDVHRKGIGDFVTDVDVRAERRLERLLRDLHPDHGFLGEESEPHRADAEFVWVVDPIDGTSNFAQGLPMFAVSVACVRAGQPIAAAAYCMPEAVVYSAAQGLGAWRDRRRIRAASASLDDAAVLGVQWVRGVWEPELLEALCRSGARIRTFGSSVTQLCDVATGRLHANVQTQGRAWDIAAAGLIAEEAGARFTDWQGRPIFPFTEVASPRHYPSIAAPRPLHAALVRLLGHGGR